MATFWWGWEKNCCSQGSLYDQPHHLLAVLGQFEVRLPSYCTCLSIMLICTHVQSSLEIKTGEGGGKYRVGDFFSTFWSMGDN